MASIVHRTLSSEQNGSPQKEFNIAMLVRGNTGLARFLTMVALGNPDRLVDMLNSGLEVFF